MRDAADQRRSGASVRTQRRCGGVTEPAGGAAGERLCRRYSGWSELADPQDNGTSIVIHTTAYMYIYISIHINIQIHTYVYLNLITLSIYLI